MAPWVLRPYALKTNPISAFRVFDFSIFDFFANAWYRAHRKKITGGLCAAMLFLGVCGPPPLRPSTFRLFGFSIFDFVANA